MRKGLVLLICTSLIWSSIQIPVYAKTTDIMNVETEQITVSGQEIEDYSVWAEFQDEIDEGEPCGATEIDVEASYSATAAINYAKSHMASGHSSSSSCPNGWLCAEFVSNCLQQGGLGNATKTGCRGLFNELKTKGTAYTLSVESDGRIKVTGANAGKISPGDVIITYCKSHDLYLHAVLVSGSDSSGYVLNYAHNSNKKNAVLYESRYCTKKGGNESYSNVTAYVIHFPQPTPPAPSDPIPVLESCSANNQTGSGFSISYSVRCEGDMTTLNDKLQIGIQSPDGNWHIYDKTLEGYYNSSNYVVNFSTYANAFGAYNWFVYPITGGGKVGDKISGTIFRPASAPTVKLDLGSSFDAYIQTEYDTYLTADSDNDVKARTANGNLSQRWTFTRTSDGYYFIRNKANGYGLDADGGLDVSGTNIMAHNPHEGANQQWAIYDAGNGSYYLKPKSSNVTVMDSPSYGQDGGNIYLCEFHGGQNQKFVISKSLITSPKVDLGSSFDAYIQTKYGTYLTADSDNNVSARAGNGQLNQKWTFKRTQDGYYQVINQSNSWALDAYCYGDSDGTNVWMYTTTGAEAQIWGIYSCGDGSYYFMPKYSGKMVMESQSGSADGSNIHLMKYAGGHNQKFIIQNISPITYKVTLTQTTGGDVSGAGTYKKGAAVTLKATPKTGYKFDGWYSGTTRVSSSTSYTVTVNRNMTYTANFSEISSSGTQEKMIENFVSRMYTVALNREAEAAGLNDWSSQLAEQQIDGAGIANGFINSAEFTNRNLSDRAFLDTLYETFFNRPADAGGKAYWMQQLSNGMSRTEVLSGFVNSQEFSNLCDNYGIARGTMQQSGSSIYRPGVRNYVLRMYTKALNRAGETVGVEDWTNRINTGTMSAENVAKSFFSSQEFINRNLSNSAYVETLYQTFMDRPSDASGKQYWIDKLNSGMSREQVLEGFSRSAEFSEIMSRYGL